MGIRPIKTEKDYSAALEQIDKLFDAKPGTAAGDRLEVLLALVGAYEAKRWPIEPADPVEAIRERMRQTGFTQADLARLLGSRSRASEILRRKRPLTLQMAWRLNREWGVPAESLIQPFKRAG